MKMPRWIIALAIVLLASHLIVQDVQPTYALCTTPTHKGSWSNTNPNTRSITRANIRFQCQDQILNGQPYPPGYPFYVRLFGKCYPIDCAWAEVGLSRATDGWLRGTIDQGFAIRQIWIKWYTPDRLRIYIWTDFRDNRTDYSSDEWFRRLSY